METNLAKTMGDALRVARKSKGLTQEDAAERAGISFEFFSRIERGGTLPSVPTLVRLASALDVSADELLGLRAGHLGGTAAAHPPSGEGDDGPDLRRLMRRLRKARPKTVRLLAILTAELERGAVKPPARRDADTKDLSA